MEQTARAMWSRAALGADWRDEVLQLARSAEPLARARRVLARLRVLPSAPAQPPARLLPVQVVFLVRDNLRRRRSIEQAYVDAISRAQTRVDLVCPYFYPGRLCRRAGRRAAWACAWHDTRPHSQRLTGRPACGGTTV